MHSVVYATVIQQRLVQPQPAAAEEKKCVDARTRPAASTPDSACEGKPAFCRQEHRTTVVWGNSRPSLPISLILHRTRAWCTHSASRTVTWAAEPGAHTLPVDAAHPPGARAAPQPLPSQPRGAPGTHSAPPHGDVSPNGQLGSEAGRPCCPCAAACERG